MNKAMMTMKMRRGGCSGRGFVGEIHCDGRHGEDCDMTVLVVVTVVIMDEDEEDQQELDYL